MYYINEVNGISPALVVFLVAIREQFYNQNDLYFQRDNDQDVFFQRSIQLFDVRLPISRLKKLTFFEDSGFCDTMVEKHNLNITHSTTEWIVTTNVPLVTTPHFPDPFYEIKDENKGLAICRGILMTYYGRLVPLLYPEKQYAP